MNGGNGLQAGILPDKLIMTSAKSEKKPFTYLPGGMNLSEIKSPRMARRLAKHQANMTQVIILDPIHFPLQHNGH